MIVAVGSLNPTKIRAVRMVFRTLFSSVTVKGVAVDSGVSAQPMTDEETYAGAVNRAKRALAICPTATYGVGIEGGIEVRTYGWFERSLVVIVDKHGSIGVGTSGGLALPGRVVQLIQEGKNLEEAIDLLFDTHKIGRGIGMFGVMTKSFVTRSIGVSHGVAFAFSRFRYNQMWDGS